MEKPDINKFYKGNLSWLPKNTLFLTLHGSHSYGTSTPTSDVDVKGFAVAPKDYYYGYLKNFEQAEFKEKDPDGVVYELRKFFKLAGEGNPSILEVLFADESDWCSITPAGRKIVDNRDLFVSTKVKFTFLGYAVSQLKRINLHYRWLKNPAKKPPERVDFGLPEKPRLSKDQFGAVEAQIKKKMEEWDINWDLLEPAERINMQEKIANMLTETKVSQENLWTVAAKQIGFEDNFLIYVQKEKEYKQKLADWQSYLDWQKNRNPVRAEIEAKYGFDCKHAMHLVRLIRMGKEILSTGKVIVKRPDAKELLEIRNGAWTYEKLIEWTEKEIQEVENLYRNCSVIPKTPNYEKLEKLCIETIEEFHSSNKGQ